MDAKLMEMISVLLPFERKSAESLKSTIDETENSVVKMFLSRMMWDSLKHAAMLQTIIDLNSGEVIWDIDKQLMIKALNYHIETEEKMLKGIRDVLEILEDKKTEPVLREILADEKRHHQILTRLKDIVESIDVSKENWLDLYRKRLQEEWPGF